MPVIGWDEATPSDGEAAGLGDDRIRSLKTSLRQALDGEHVWPSGGGDCGVHRLGSARAYVATQSAVSSSGTEGRLFHASDTSNLFGVGSGGTTYLGGPRVVSMADFPGTVPQRHQWIEEWGFGVTSSSGSTVVTIPNSGYSGAPWVMLTGRGTSASSAGPAFSYTSVSGTVFHVRAISNSVLVPDCEFAWFSRGSRVL